MPKQNENNHFKDSLDKFFKKYSLLKNQNKFAVAVSGGPDSMALAHLVINIANDADKQVYCMTVDHGLRDTAKDEAQMVKHWCDQFVNVHHVTLEWQGIKPETALMEAARDARYQLMADYCERQDIKTLFVAHHQDDQAETFLFRLSKGSGLDGLACMDGARIYNDNLSIMRPLLQTSKQDLVNYCTQHDVPFIKDATNNNTNYMRPRLRKSMEVMAAEGLTSKRLASTAKRLYRAKQALQLIAEDVFKSNLIQKDETKFILNFNGLKQQPEEIIFRVIQQALEEMRGGADYNVRMDRLEELIESLLENPKIFKPRTLGGCIFSLKRDKDCGNTSLWLEKEHALTP